MGMMTEFKEFIAKGNVLDLAVGVIIGAAFGKIVTSLTEDVIMPVVGRIFGGVDFKDIFIRLGDIPAGYTGPQTYDALKAAGVPMIGIGSFIGELINFLILAFVIFQIVKAANRMIPATKAAAPADPEDVVLLREIRDSLKR